jgi:DNA integrity scanning protein DisA with diadenylate cyclase activity
VIISGEEIVAAGCIMPVSDRSSLPSRFGLRHRAAIGIAEKTNALALVVSEETGDISIADGDDFVNKIEPDNLKEMLRKATENP